MASPAADAARPRAKCLLVDDSRENLLVLSALLQADDIELLSATSGTGALELLLDNEFALALLDVQMPGMDGFQLAEFMRGSERTRQVPIIFVTAGAHDERRVFRGYESGAVDFLYKPINPDILRNKAEVFFQLWRQKRQIETDLQQKTEALHVNEMFTAVLGHDLRDPLNAILLSAQLIQRRPDVAVVQENAARILSSGQRMQNMIADLLDLARGRLGKGILLQHDEADLGVLVARVVEEFRASHVERTITVTCTGSLLGRWDPTRLSQVISNLLGNALQHGAGTAPVEVVLDGLDAGQVELAVSNAGSIAQELRAEIFEPFRRGIASAGHGQGLGLGLYIVQQIIHAHGGRVELDCARPGVTTFRAQLPRMGGDAPVTLESRPALP